MPDTPLKTARTDRILSLPWWRRRPFQIGAAAAVVGILTLSAFIVLPPPNTVTVAADSLDTGEVTRAAFQDYVALRAAVEPLDITYITAETNGRVISVAASDGIMVTSGQPLAMLGNPDLTLQVSSREADISARLSDTNNQLMNLQTQQQTSEQAVADVAYALHRAEEELSKRQMLREHGVYNDAAVQTYIDEVAYQTQRLAALKSQQAQQAQFYTRQRQQILASANDLRQSREEVRKGLNALNLTAPMQGRLTDFNLKPGQAVKMGDPLGEVDSEGTYKLKAEVDEFYLSRLSVGLKATANVHGKDTAVHISKVFPQVNNGRITVELEFDQMPADLKRGETVDVRLSLGATEMALLAPSGAWLNDTGGASIFVLTGSGDKASRRTITVGRRNPEYVEILSGLKPGEHVVTGGASNLLKAQHLRLTKSAK
ncbi:efflux RND transporter periplasmic adaptor subunit [Asticcacaulis sp.]|uniref:efflux RND transporter periplasmic adaptor subunit n=1 Tax=Asticcacaulis sp. TaxID=1872648 RepID=UPI002CA478E4|nr:efflux RND transporter periplasmic adaptor subunit [Asticcacaulis sp.]HTM79853.1 efflux RND transporter periplasmic adaptor subunit [Asticcacaulis sp.]